MPSGVYSHKRRNPEDRFWPKVEKSPSGCWLWIGAVSRFSGYGHFHFAGEQRAHRVSYILSFGQIPDGMFVLHACDNRRCVRPDHLFLGNHTDNMKDAKRKGRLVPPPKVFGERHHLAKLSDENVAFIRANYKPRDPVYGATALSRRFNVSPSLIFAIGSGTHRNTTKEIPKWEHLKHHN